MSSGWDAVVIGGGPAGSSAAIKLAEAGYACLLLEREVFPRARPGETLHPGVEPLLRQVGVWDSAALLSTIRPSGVQVSIGDGLTCWRYGEDVDGAWRAVNIARSDLDNLLLDRARRGGVVVAQGRVRALSVFEGRVCGVVTSAGTFRAGVVIDAAGGSHLMARLLRLGIERRSPPLVAKYGYVRGIVPIAADQPLFSFDSIGWTWIARVDSDVTHWTRLNVMSACQEPKLPARRTKPCAVATLPAIGATRGADATWRIVSEPAGRGYFIAGDAAAVLDPASSDGVIRALLSGRMAGHLAALMLARSVHEDDAAVRHCSWTREQFERRVTKLSQTYSAAFPGWEDVQPDGNRHRVASQESH